MSEGAAGPLPPGPRGGRALGLLVVDDSVVYRQLLQRLLSAEDLVARVDVAPDGPAALALADKLRPDVVTLDIEMPGMSGLEVLRRMRAAGHPAAAVIVSAYTPEGSRLAAKALELGAVGVVAKPAAGSGGDRVAALRRELVPILEGLAGQPPLGGTPSPSGRLTAPPRSGVAGPPEVVAIGASTGGPAALMEVLGGVRADLPVPVVVALHLPRGFTGQLVLSLDRRAGPTVVEGRSGEPLEPGRVYLAPGGTQMRVACRPGDGAAVIEGTDDPPENNCKPSVDYLFRSVAEVYEGRSLGVILTGMGTDGTVGLARMRRQGAGVIAQDEASSVVFGMPGSAVRAGIVDEVVPLSEVAARICYRF